MKDCLMNRGPAYYSLAPGYCTYCLLAHLPGSAAYLLYYYYYYCLNHSLLCTPIHSLARLLGPTRHEQTTTNLPGSSRSARGGTRRAVQRAHAAGWRRRPTSSGASAHGRLKIHTCTCTCTTHLIPHRRNDSAGPYFMFTPSHSTRNVCAPSFKWESALTGVLVTRVHGVVHRDPRRTREPRVV